MEREDFQETITPVGKSKRKKRFLRKKNKYIPGVPQLSGKGNMINVTLGILEMEQFQAIF